MSRSRVEKTKFTRLSNFFWCHTTFNEYLRVYSGGTDKKMIVFYCCANLTDVRSHWPDDRENFTSEFGEPTQKVEDTLEIRSHHDVSSFTIRVKFWIAAPTSFLHSDMPFNVDQQRQFRPLYHWFRKIYLFIFKVDHIFIAQFAETPEIGHFARVITRMWRSDGWTQRVKCQWFRIW